MAKQLDDFKASLRWGRSSLFPEVGVHTWCSNEPGHNRPTGSGKGASFRRAKAIQSLSDEDTALGFPLHPLSTSGQGALQFLYANGQGSPLVR